MWRGDLSGSSWSWTNVSSKAGGDSIHPDQHAIAFAAGAPDVVWVGNDGGVFVSPNRGVSWRHLNTGLAITEIEYVAQNRGDARWLLAGTQDNGTIRYDGSATWLHSQDGDGGDCAVNAANPATVFHTFFGMGMQRSTSKGDKNSWVSRGPNVAETYNALFYPPVEANDAVIAQAGESLFVSHGRGDVVDGGAIEPRRRRRLGPRDPDRDADLRRHERRRRAAGRPQRRDLDASRA